MDNSKIIEIWNAHPPIGHGRHRGTGGEVLRMGGSGGMGLPGGAGLRQGEKAVPWKRGEVLL